LEKKQEPELRINPLGVDERPMQASNSPTAGRRVGADPKVPDREEPHVDADDVERLVRLGPKELTWPEVCARAGISHEVADPLWRALGFPDIPPDQPAYTTDDVRALRIAAEGIESLRGDHRRAALDAIVREARMVSSHMTRIAEIEVESMGEVGGLGLRERVLAEASERGVEHSDLGWVLLYAFRRRLEEALRQRVNVEASDHPTLAVGFVDLVDFTRTSGSMQTDELGRLLGRFEALASDVITEAGGRVVKLIGDEAMFVCPTPEGAAQGAIELVDACAAGDLPSARAGLSLGPVLARGGDYFGRAVNLASRLVDVAPPDTVLADDPFAQAISDSLALVIEPQGPKRLKGLGSVHASRVRSAGRDS
jgi:adenylate cyclase